MLVKPSTPSMNVFTGLMDTYIRLRKGSALLEHLAQEISPNCEFNSDNIKILDSCSNDLKLRYVESIHLKHSKQDSKAFYKNASSNINGAFRALLIRCRISYCALEFIVLYYM